jgi:hypothetical protein
MVFPAKVPPYNLPSTPPFGGGKAETLMHWKKPFVALALLAMGLAPAHAAWTGARAIEFSQYWAGDGTALLAPVYQFKLVGDARTYGFVVNNETTKRMQTILEKAESEKRQVSVWWSTRYNAQYQKVWWPDDTGANWYQGNIAGVVTIVQVMPPP